MRMADVAGPGRERMKGQGQATKDSEPDEVEEQ
jgi:hypothetical protein